MTAAPDTPAAVRVAELHHRFGDTNALSGVSFDVHHGEIFGLLGPNGAGKTTIMRMLLTLLRPDAGHAEVAGLDVVAHGDAARASVGWVPQERAVDPLMSARQNLRFAAGLHHLPRRQGRQRTEQLLAMVGLTTHAHRLVREFSGGMRRRLELAMGLIGDPLILFLDEPTLGLDIAARRTVWQQVEHIRAAGRTVMLTTHYLDEAESLCDRVAIIDSGRILAIGSPMQLTRDHGRATVTIALTQPAGELVATLQQHPAIDEVQINGSAIVVKADDAVAATEGVLAECRRRELVPLDLRVWRASLEDVFVRLTGQILDATGTASTSHAAASEVAELAP